ncbi:hypothetical protein [Streptomyces sp. HC307]|uniref:hypothetical protein n=1 Tax=Streptomyces flavusporus TaxID=3385496 RepID=UPI003916FF1B
MPNVEQNKLTPDQQIRAAAATAAATMYGHFIGATATDEEDLYRREPMMTEDTLRMALLFEQYIRTGTFPGDQRV